MYFNKLFTLLNTFLDPTQAQLHNDSVMTPESHDFKQNPLKLSHDEQLATETLPLRKYGANNNQDNLKEQVESRLITVGAVKHEVCKTENIDDNSDQKLGENDDVNILESTVSVEIPVPSKSLTTNSELKSQTRETQREKRVDENQPMRPKFGIPPLRTTCWVPGVTENLLPDHVKFIPHPAYLATLKDGGLEQGTRRADENMQDPNNLDDVNKDTKALLELGITSLTETCSVPNVTEISPSDHIKFEPNSSNLTAIDDKLESVSEGENMWDNDNWDDVDKYIKEHEKTEQISRPSEISSVTQLVDSKKKVEENMWLNDEPWNDIEYTSDANNFNSSEKRDEDTWNEEWEPITDDVTQCCTHSNDLKAETSSWSGWGGWGLSSVLSLTNQVTQGLNTVLDVKMNIAEPEELARFDVEKEMTESSENKPILGFGLNNLVQGVSQITKLVETTSNKVITGGLDTLETIGKKTMEVLQESDPGLKKKRAFLSLHDDKPILSQILREAKEKAENESKERQQTHITKKPNYELLFDDHQGLVHLEALEMLSKQCDIKLETVLSTCSGETLTDMQETLEQIKELCELPEEDEDETVNVHGIREKLEDAVSEINIKITYDKLLSTWEETEDWMNKINLSVCSERELHQQAVETLAQLTAMAVEQFHKGGELLLVKEHRSTADEADSLVQ